jgi:hypothetical protein
MTSSHAAGRSVADRNFRSSFYVRFTDRTLLAEPFTLALREDVATTTATPLKVAGTHKLRAATGAGGCQGQQAAPDPSGVPVQNAICSGQTMAQLAEQLPRMAGAYFPGGQQVVDETGLSGTWDFELKWMPRAMLAQAGADAITIQSAIEKLGLKLEPKEMNQARRNKAAAAGAGHRFDQRDADGQLIGHRISRSRSGGRARMARLPFSTIGRCIRSG